VTWPMEMTAVRISGDWIIRLEDMKGFFPGQLFTRELIAHRLCFVVILVLVQIEPLCITQTMAMLVDI
jgi:hypothetical protein